jgi:hypothetical protein
MSQITVSNAFERELRKLIAEEGDQIGEQMVNGMAIDSHEKYREMVGKIAGLRLALELCSVASEIVNKQR